MRAAFLALLALLPGCALLQPCPVDKPAARFLDDYLDARSPESDGGPAITDGERHVLDRDAHFVEAALEEKSKPFKFPTTGIPWVDGLLGAGTIATTILASIKGADWHRDRKRRKRGEPTDTKPAETV